MAASHSCHSEVPHMLLYMFRRHHDTSSVVDQPQLISNEVASGLDVKACQDQKQKRSTRRVVLIPLFRYCDQYREALSYAQSVCSAIRFLEPRVNPLVAC